jgi:hypothetical protein
VDTGQIDAQMPWAIPGSTVATVIVKNGSFYEQRRGGLRTCVGRSGHQRVRKLSRGGGKRQQRRE